MLLCHVSDHHVGQPQPPESITTHVIRYKANDVLVMLDWALEDGVSYSVTTIPPLAAVFNTSTSVELVLHYNTQYNTSILATLCGQSDTTITFYHVLNFGESTH